MSREAVEHGKIAAVFDIDGTLLPAPSLELRLLVASIVDGTNYFGSAGRKGI
jgi:hypothetical protein